MSGKEVVVELLGTVDHHRNNDAAHDRHRVDGANNRCPSMLPRTWLAVHTASSMDTRSSALRKLTNTSDCGARNRYLTKYAEVYKKKTSGVIIACTAPPFDVMLVSFPERGAVGSCLPHWRERAASIRTRAKRLPS